MNILYKNKYRYIEFLGDFSFHNINKVKRLSKKKYIYRIVNLETFFTKKNNFTFRIDSNLDLLLKNLNILDINCLVVSNNHIFDGSEFLLDSFLKKIKKKKIDVIGFKKNSNFPNSIIFNFKNNNIKISASIDKKSFNKHLKLTNSKKLKLETFNQHFFKKKKTSKTIVFLHGGKMYSFNQKRAKQISKQLNKNIFLIQCGSHIPGFYYKNFYSGLGNFIFNDFKYKFINHVLNYKNSLIEQIGIKIKYDIAECSFEKEFFYSNYNKKDISHHKIIKIKNNFLFNTFITFLSFLYSTFLIRRTIRFIKHRFLKLTNY